ncbi:MAG: DUF1732 domain-containing protein [Candidatus Omnitrophica bacterium]|nr:DUF1732 domain-containing protein [Candidatus Omnitrophota bacterium]MDD5573708.1 DUF1732 domain-containing protein [Candidatus Omnitrophota bacterium]
MIVSMTGFGQAQAERKGERFIVTIKSLNHRYCETQFHLPAALEHLEGDFRTRILKTVKRGRLTVSVTHINEAAEDIVLNEKLIDKYYKVLEALRRRLKLVENVSVSSLVSLPGVLSYRKEELRFRDKELLLRKALREALGRLVEMKRREGAALQKDLERCVATIAGKMALVKKRVRDVIEANRKVMAPDALESFLRSTDVGEEITRIDFHVNSFHKHVRMAGPKGKILDFIAQELQREINTLGAKVQEKHIAYQVVMIKDQIEKIREQVQNVE